jgi:hypothetical protein
LDTFFTATQDALDQITELYNFIWPTISAMWNFRWQIKGFVNEVGEENVTDQDLLKRFDWGSRIHGVNLKRAYLEQTWEVQQERFAKILLINVISTYESWLEDIQTTLNFNIGIYKSLQYPTRYDVNSIPCEGVLYGLKQIQTNQSLPIKDAFYYRLITNRKYSFIHLNNLLKCYRFFKESRNCIAHHGEKVDQKLVDAYNAFSLIATCADLGLHEVPNHAPAILNTPVRIRLRGVVGFSDVIIRMITTLDVEFSIAIQAESELLSRCRDYVAQYPRDPKLRNRHRSAEERTRSLLGACGFPSATKVTGITSLLQQNGILQ